MESVIVLVFGALWLTSCRADISVSDYIYWKKADIVSWDQYFPSRALEQERLTNQAAVTAVNSMSTGMESSLAKVLAFQVQELQTAQLLMAGTDAEGCVNGISNFIKNAVQDEIVNYNDCAADTLSKLARLSKSWNVTRTNYIAAYQRALTGIDVCAKTYPNKDSINRLKSCVESMNNNYFTAANVTQNSMLPSPSMSYFQDVVVGCASDAFNAVVLKGEQFLKMLLDCSVLDHNIDHTSYADQLNQWKRYNNTLASQISNAQSKNYIQVRIIEAEMQNYYNLQKAALEKYVIESRGLGFYQSSMYSYLGDYYNTVTATFLDNPGDSNCATAAKVNLDNVVITSASNSLACDVRIVNNTKYLITSVHNVFLTINKQMPYTGNVAILNCLSKGYVFAPNTICACFDLGYSEFDIDYADRHASIVQDVKTLSGYEAPFFSGSDLPCGGTSLKRAFLGADRALYGLQSCLYRSSGTTYSVTTPPTITTTTSITTVAP